MNSSAQGLMSVREMIDMCVTDQRDEAWIEQDLCFLHSHRTDQESVEGPVICGELSAAH